MGLVEKLFCVWVDILFIDRFRRLRIRPGPFRLHLSVPWTVFLFHKGQYLTRYMCQIDKFNSLSTNRNIIDQNYTVCVFALCYVALS